MVDTFDNRATVTIGETQIEIVASKLAEKYYGDRFRHDVEALGESDSTRLVKMPRYDAEGKPVVDEDKQPVYDVEPMPLAYCGRLKLDIAVSANSNIGATAEIPEQVIAATWAMARAAGSTKHSYDDFYAWYLAQPSNAQQDYDLWQVVCVDLAERAFFRHYGRPNDADQPDAEQKAV